MAYFNANFSSSYRSMEYTRESLKQLDANIVTEGAILDNPATRKTVVIVDVSSAYGISYQGNFYGDADALNYIPSGSNYYYLDDTDLIFGFESNISVPFPDIDSHIIDTYASVAAVDAAVQEWFKAVQNYIEGLEDTMTQSVTYADEAGTLGLFTTKDAEIVDDIVYGSKSLLNKGIKIIGSDFDDIFDGAAGRDRINGGDGNDKLSGQGGRDILIGGKGADIINGGDHRDVLKGNSGRDILRGDAGTDKLLGGAGNDALFGGAGRDLLIGSSGKDRLSGNGSNDKLFGGSGDDKLFGGNGVDTINGGTGDDRLSGGAQADHFQFKVGHATDTITDFEDDIDTIHLDTALNGSDLNMSQFLAQYGTFVDGDAVLDFGDGDILIIENLSDLAMLIDDIEFV